MSEPASLPREPGVAGLLAEERAQLRFERPARAGTRTSRSPSSMSARVVGPARRDLQRVRRAARRSADCIVRGVVGLRGTRSRRGASRSSGARARAGCVAPSARVLARPRDVEPAVRARPASSVRCSSSIAQPSVTALSPSRRSSTEQVGATCARSARCGPPRGRARASRRRRRSAGSRARRAAGHLDRRRRTRAASSSARCSMSSSTFSCAREVDAEVARASPRARAASGPPGTPVVPARRRGRAAATSQRCVSSRPDPDAAAEEAVAASSHEPLGRVEEAAGTASASSSSRIAETAAVELDSRSGAEPARVSRCTISCLRRGRAGSGAPRSSSFRARRGRSRRSRSGSFAMRGREHRGSGSSSPSTVASSSVSSLGDLLPVLASTRLPR
mgnify:CR=1 FL=1